MCTKIEYRMLFEHSEKVIAVQGVLGGSGSFTIIDKRLSVKHKKDFDRLCDALDEFNAMRDELVACEYSAAG